MSKLGGRRDAINGTTTSEALSSAAVAGRIRFAGALLLSLRKIEGNNYDYLDIYPLRARAPRRRGTFRELNDNEHERRRAHATLRESRLTQYGKSASRMSRRCPRYNKYGTCPGKKERTSLTSPSRVAEK